MNNHDSFSLPKHLIFNLLIHSFKRILFIYFIYLQPKGAYAEKLAKESSVDPSKYSDPLLRSLAIVVKRKEEEEEKLTKVSVR